MPDPENYDYDDYDTINDLAELGVPPQFGDFGPEYIALLAAVDQGTLTILNSDNISWTDETDLWSTELDLQQIEDDGVSVIGFDASPNSDRRGFYLIQGNANDKIEKVASGTGSGHWQKNGSKLEPSEASVDGIDVTETNSDTVIVNNSLQVPSSFN